MKFKIFKTKAERAEHKAQMQHEFALLAARIAYARSPDLFQRFKAHLGQQWLLHGSLPAEKVTDIVDGFFLEQSGIIREHDESLFPYVARCCGLSVEEVERGL